MDDSPLFFFLFCDDTKIYAFMYVYSLFLFVRKNTKAHIFISSPTAKSGGRFY